MVNSLTLAAAGVVALAATSVIATPVYELDAREPKFPLGAIAGGLRKVAGHHHKHHGLGGALKKGAQAAGAATAPPAEAPAPDAQAPPAAPPSRREPKLPFGAIAGGLRKVAGHHHKHHGLGGALKKGAQAAGAAAAPPAEAPAPAPDAAAPPAAPPSRREPKLPIGAIAGGLRKVGGLRKHKHHGLGNALKQGAGALGQAAGAATAPPAEAPAPAPDAAAPPAAPPSRREPKLPIGAIAGGLRKVAGHHHRKHRGKNGGAQQPPAPAPAPADPATPTPDASAGAASPTPAAPAAREFFDEFEERDFDDEEDLFARDFEIDELD